MRKIPVIFIVLFGCLFFTACKRKGGHGPAYTLKMRLAPGDKFGQNMDMKMNMGAKLSGINMDMIMTMNSSIDMEVVGDTAGLTKLKFTYSKMDMALDIKGLPEGSVPDNNEKYKKLSAMMEGKSIYLLIDSLYSVTDVIGFDEMIAANDELYDAATRDEMKNMFSKDQLNNMMGMMFQIYPGKPVQAGESWEKEVNTSMGPIKLRCRNKYRLKEVSSGAVIIEMESAYKGKGEMAQGTNDTEIDMDGKQSGWISIGKEDGYMKSADFTIDMKAKADIMGQTVPYDIKGLYKVTGR